MNENSLTIVRDRASLAAAAPTVVYRPEYSLEPQSGSVLDYWRTICKHKRALVAFAAAGLLVAIGVTIPQTPVYRARTTLEIQDLNDDFMKMKSVNPISESSPVDGLADIQTQIKILESESLVERTLDKLNLTSSDALDPNQPLMAVWRDLLHLSAPVANRDTLLQTAAKNLKVSASGQTRIIEVSFDAPDPKLAAQFANTLTTEFIEQNMQVRWQMGRRTSEWLVGQLEDLRTKLRTSENALQAYARQKGLIYTSDKQNVSDDKLRQLQAELSKAQADRVQKESRFEVARNASPETLPDVLEDANLRALEATLVELRRQEAEIGITFKPDYSKAKQARAQISALEAAIEQKRSSIVSRIANELQEAKHREQLLSEAYGRQTRLVTDDSQNSIQYDILKHDVDTNRQIYDDMLQRVRESSIVGAMKASNVRVVDAARPPLEPYKPNLPINSAAGFLCGALLGVVTIIIRTRTDSNLREPGDAGLLLGIPELGVIPAAPRLRNAGISALNLLPRQTAPALASMPLLVEDSNLPMVADSFRAVLASIIFAGPKERQRVLVVTSAGPGEGKTTSATNLAVTLAKMNRRVLLIDGDIRSPRVHDVFGLDNSIGVTDLLRNATVDEGSAESSIHRTAFPNLSVLTSGPAVQSGADLLFTKSMASVIAHYRERFDMILIDTPPMLSMPDARVLGRMADAVVLIARAGQTSREAIQAAVRRFVEDQTPVLGLILNDWKAKSSTYKYYAAYRKPVTVEPSVKPTTARA